MAFFTYIMAGGPAGTLYTGSTDNLARRMEEHRQKSLRGFSARYNVVRLVWFESHETRELAFRRERRIKEWRRRWKIELIEQENPRWDDLIAELGLGDLTQVFLARLDRAALEAAESVADGSGGG